MNRPDLSRRAKENVSREDPIPKATAERLSLYLRQLELFASEMERTVSSRRLGMALGLTDAQVRKDLAYFGQFGRPGVGYDVTGLVEQIKRIIGTDKRWPTAIIGIGNLGRALATYAGFRARGFDVVALLDSDPKKIGKSCAGLPIHGMGDLSRLARTLEIKLCVIAVPAAAAQEAADAAAEAGVKGVLNFAPVRLAARGGMAVQAVDLAIQMEQLAFRTRSSRTPKP